MKKVFGKSIQEIKRRLRRIFHLVIGIFLVLFTGCSGSSKKQNADDKVLTLSNQNLMVTIDLKNSARIASFTYKGYELLTSSDVHDFNFGSTLWPAPQHAWGWPPPSVLDGEAYLRLESPDGVIRAESNIDTQTGLKFIKEFQLVDSNTFQINYEIVNETDSLVSTAAWEVTRTNGGLSFFPGNDTAILALSTMEPTEFSNGIYWYQYPDEGVQKSAKLFAETTAGWLAHVIDSMLFVKEFQDIPSGAQAPEQGEIEIFTSGEFPYIELENHSVYKQLGPGENLKYKVKWHVRKLPGTMSYSVKDTLLLRYVSELLTY